MPIAKKINTLIFKQRYQLLVKLSRSVVKIKVVKIKLSDTLTKAKGVVTSNANGTLLVLSLLLLSVNQASTAQSINYDSNGLKIELSDDIQAAIDNGVSLTFENQFARTHRLFFISWHNKLVQHDFVVTRHSLSNRYLVHESNKLEPRIFSSTRETMTYISEAALSRFSKYHAQQPHSSTGHKMRLRLSKTKLPGPMRLTAFIANDWDLNSGWKSWQSDQ